MQFITSLVTSCKKKQKLKAAKKPRYKLICDDFDLLTCEIDNLYAALTLCYETHTTMQISGEF